MFTLFKESEFFFTWRHQTLTENKEEVTFRPTDDDLCVNIWDFVKGNIL